MSELAHRFEEGGYWMYVTVLLTIGTAVSLLRDIRALKRTGRRRAHALQYGVLIGCIPMSASGIGFVVGMCMPFGYGGSSPEDRAMALAAAVAESTNNIAFGTMCSVFVTLPIAMYWIGCTTDGRGPFTRID